MQLTTGQSVTDAQANGHAAKLRYTGRCEKYVSHGREYLIESWEHATLGEVHLARDGDRYLRGRGTVERPHDAGRGSPRTARLLADYHAVPRGSADDCAAGPCLSPGCAPAEHPVGCAVGGQDDAAFASDLGPGPHVTFTPEGGQEVEINGVRSAQFARGGLEWPGYFCPPGEDVWSTAEWGYRDVEIRGADGALVYGQKDVYAPVAWSDQAVRIVASKFFYGDADLGNDPSAGGRESSVKALIHRVTDYVGSSAWEDGYFATARDAQRFTADLAWLCLHQYAAFNSPVWFNVGVGPSYGVRGGPGNWVYPHRAGPGAEAVPCADSYAWPQIAACYIQPVDDSIEGIMRLAASEARLFKHGSGTGTDVSTLRSCREKVAGGGRASGPVSFMRIWDAVASTVKSGGRSRRAAKLQSMRVTHPDVREFIVCKRDEDRKARALIASGACAGTMAGTPDEAYSSVCFQNSNVSVRFTDAFLRAAEEGLPWQTTPVLPETPDADMPAYDASGLLDLAAECCWECGDPGAQYHDTINAWNTTPNGGEICGSNPCGEYNHLNDSACNLASLNLLRFVRAEDDFNGPWGGPAGTFNAGRFRAACRAFFVAQDVLVDRSSYPTKAIAETAHAYREIGLGYTNLGGLLMTQGLPYDSPAGRRLAAAVTALMHAEAVAASADLARVLGPFDGYAADRENLERVVGRHRDEAYRLYRETEDARGDGTLAYQAARAMDRALEAVRGDGARNSQWTLLAPCGTIAFMMDSDTTGVEPELALVKYKSLAGGGLMKLTNRLVGPALAGLGYGERGAEAVLAHVAACESIEGAPGLDPGHLPVFDCALEPPGGGRSIAPSGHVDMMAAVQPFLSGAISKTVNVPAWYAPADVRALILDSWRKGLKAVAIYRDGSKGAQPLNTGKKPTPAAGAAPGVLPPGPPAQDAVMPAAAPGEFRGASGPAGATAGPVRPRRERLPETRAALTHKFSVAGHEGYVNLGFYPDGRPGEVFVRMAKEGSTVGGLLDALATAVSIGLQYGVPLDVYAAKFARGRYEPAGVTQNPEIPFATSLTDYIFRWLSGRQSLAAKDPGPPAPAVTPEPGPAAGPYATAGLAAVPSDLLACPDCGAMMPRLGTCYLCLNCSYSSGCS